METWHVYQLRSDTGLLYVGHARRLKIRLDQHRQQKPWWPEVTEVRSEEFATKDEAILREKELWADGRPKYNRASPFRTDEEWREHNREYDRRRRQTVEYRQRQSATNRTPEHRAYMRAFSQKPEQRVRNRERQRIYRARLRQQQAQDGPGLF
jgi:predicted GIY-YIG superfamily endonuclease